MGWDGSGEFYTVDIPGINDIVSVPALDDKARIAERLQLLRTQRSPLPDGFDWMPSWIAHIDDARQWMDLAAPIAIPTMLAVQGIGTAGAIAYLSVREILTLMTSGLYLFANGESGKQRWFLQGGKMLLGRAGALDLIHDYARRGPWGTALSAGSKIAYRLTGYGINVLPIWSAATDAFWGSIRALQGKQVIIRPPPSSDMGTAAVRYLLNASMQPWIGARASLDDHKLLLLANVTAAQYIQQHQSLLNPDNMSTLIDSQIAYTEPTNPTSLEVLDEQLGWRPGMDFTPAYPASIQNATYTDLATATWNQRIAHEDALRARFTPNHTAGLYQALSVDAGLAGWSTISNGTSIVKPNYPLPIVTIGHAIEQDIFPPWIKDRTFPWFGTQGSTEENRVEGTNTPRAWKLATDVKNTNAQAIRAWADLMAEMWRTGGPPGSLGGKSAIIAAGAIWGAFSTIDQFPGQTGYTLAEWLTFKANQRFYKYSLREQLSIKPPLP